MNLLEQKVKVLENKIKTSEQKRFFLTEMKKIGIEKLPYSYSSLNKFIDSKTMDVHYNKHYKGYVKKLNKALSEKKYGDVELEEIVKSISKYNKTIRNNAGGAFNHALFWKMLSPKKQEPKGDVLKKIKSEFGGYQQFKKKFEELAKTSFGSGWIWLTLTKQNKLKLIKTPNQDNPLMNVIDNGGFPILGLDLWEHAYYLKYQSNRDEYISNFWNCVNWDFVETLYQSKQKKKTIKESIDMGVKENLKGCTRDEAEKYKFVFNTNPKVKWNFRKKIDEVLKNLYPENWYEDNQYEEGQVSGLYDFRGEQGRSILNRLNTNYYCYCTLINDVNKVLYSMKQKPIDLFGKTPKEQLEENDRFLKFIEEYASRIFSTQSLTLKKIYNTLEMTDKSGRNREESVVKKLKGEFGDENVTMTAVLGGSEDTRGGVDCVVNHDGQRKTVQIKPYNEIVDMDDKFIIKGTGSIKKYKTDWMAFQKTNQPVYVFDNKNIEIVDGEYNIPKSSLLFKL